MQKLLMWLQLVPAIIGIVREIEKAIPQRGKGAEKLNMVLDVVDVAVAAAPEVAGAIEAKDVRGTVTKIVNATVGVMNKTGAFPKDNPPTPAPAEPQ